MADIWTLKLFLLVLVLPGIVRTDCMDGWTRFQDSCYLFGHDDLSFMDAERFCVHFSSHLANIETATENTFIRSYLRDLKDRRHWIGMTDELIEGIWKHYPSETTATFLDWGSGQPEQGKAANCVAIWAGFDYHWVDEPCTNRFKPLCEKPAFLASCVASEGSCSQLDTMEAILEKMVRNQLKVEKLDKNVQVIHSTMDTALKSAENQMGLLESKIEKLEENVAGKLTTWEEMFNRTLLVTKKLSDLGISLDSPLTTTCDDGWISFQGSCYYFGTTDVPFAEAQRFCVENLANLVNIETERENNFIRAQLREMKAPKHWIGMTDEAVEGIWTFVPSGATVTFFEWGARQPNNGRVSNCMAIWESFGYLWVDEPCRNKFRPICEKKAGE